MNVKIMAVKGMVHVTYSYKQAEKASEIMEALQALDDARQVVCTEAQTNLLWIQESFSADDGSYNEVISLANAWDAAVEILKMTPSESEELSAAVEKSGERGPETWRQTGIIDDQDDYDSAEPPDVQKICERLINDGRSGGKRILQGSRQNLLNSIDRSGKYRLIVFDNMFQSKNPEARKRLAQEWSNALSESLKTPVISLSELRARYRFGPKQMTKMAIFGLLTFLVVFAVFHFDQPIMKFLLQPGTGPRILATICILVFIPTFAFTYSTVTSLFLRMIKLD
jgi:hypothetical protein